jgi:trans-2,3-dihydro-3-hydroxyanthranilate isomerase
MNSPLSLRYRVVDVFTTEALLGNPLAVFPEASGIDEATMQRIAKELNLSETTFVVRATRPGCAVRVRIFTPHHEMTFAGHPTVGTSYVLLDEGIIPRDTTSFSLDEKVGAVPIRVDAGERPLIWLRTPPISEGSTYDGALCAQALGLDPDDLIEIAPQLLSAGNPIIFVPLKDKGAVDRAWLDARALRAVKPAPPELICIFVFTPTTEGAYSRMFAPDFGVAEDPATGSATGPLAAFMIKHGLVSGKDGTRFISEQGTKMARRSILHVQIFGENGATGIDVGGYVTPVIEARMTI